MSRERDGMTKQAKNFRLDDVMIQHLDEISDALGINNTRVIEWLLDLGYEALQELDGDTQRPYDRFVRKMREYKGVADKRQV